MAAYVQELPRPYWPLPPIVVDASLVAAIVFDEADHLAAAQALQGRQPVAPGLLRFEITNVAMKKLRRGELQLNEALEALALFASFNIEYGEIEPDQVLRLAHRYKLSGYDASYLWLAGEIKAPLGTLDRELGGASKDYLSGLPDA